jgi:hypothetical protein
MDQLYTRQQILDAMALFPCHVTGLHDPTHTTKGVCSLQLSESFKRLLVFLKIGEDHLDQLPRKLHENCYWCNTEPKHGEELRMWATQGADNPAPTSPAPGTTEAALLEATEGLLALVDDMARFVGKMVLQDYQLFNEAPINARRAIMLVKGEPQPGEKDAVATQ